MSLETLRVTGEVADSGLVANDHTDHNLDPDVSSTTVNAVDNNTSTTWGGDFGTPSENPTVGNDLQEFRVGVLEFDSGQTGVPTARIELWENGSLVRAGSNIAVSTYAVLSFKWNASEIANATGSLVQIRLVCVKSGGGPTKRNTVRIGHMEWNADVTAGPVTNTQSVAITHTTAETLATAIVHAVGSAITHTAAATLGKTIKMAKAVGHSVATTLTKVIKVSKSVSHSASVSLAKAITRLFTSSVSLVHTASVIAIPAVVFLVSVSVNLAHAALVIANPIVVFFVSVSVSLVHTFSLATNVIFKNLGRALDRSARSWRRMFGNG